MTNRLFSTFFGALSVKDPQFAGGAKGDGVTNDSAAIQACFNAAFGSIASPNGTDVPGVYNNKNVVFPPGHYIVQPNINPITVSSITVNGNGSYTYNFGSAHGLSGATVVCFMDGTSHGGLGADGNFNRIAYVTLGDSGGLSQSTKVTTIATGLGGINAYDANSCTMQQPCLAIRGVGGTRIIGSGRGSTRIDASSGGIAFAADFLVHSSIEGIRFVSSGSKSVACWIDSDSGDPSGFVASEAVTIKDCFFAGATHGLVIGPTFNGQCSEFLYENIICDTNSVAGLEIGGDANSNALAHTVIGGNFTTCGIGIWCRHGSVGPITGSGFQNNTSWDIKVDNGARDTFQATGCRSEGSPNFCSAAAVQVNLDACLHVYFGGSSSTFFHGFNTGGFALRNCNSYKGVVNFQPDGFASIPGGLVEGCQFGSHSGNWLVNNSDNSRTYVRQTRMGDMSWGNATDFPTVLTLSANCVSSNVINVVSVPSWVRIGMRLWDNTGNNRIFNYTITNISGTTITMSAAATGTALSGTTIAVAYTYDRAMWSNGVLVGVDPDASLAKTTFSGLPVANSVGAWPGAKGFITDCNSATLGAAAAGGGSNHVPVTWDDNASNWKVG